MRGRFLTGASFLKAWLTFLLSCFIPDSNVFLCQVARSASFTHRLLLWCDKLLLPVFFFPLAAFSFLFSNSCPPFSSCVHYILALPCRLRLFHLVASRQCSSHVCVPLLISTPSPWLCAALLSSFLPFSAPALVDWARDLRHDLCGGGARLRAHGDHKQLSHSDEVMDHTKSEMHVTIGDFIYSEWALHWDREGLPCRNNAEAARKLESAPSPWRFIAAEHSQHTATQLLF